MIGWIFAGAFGLLALAFIGLNYVNLAFGRDYKAERDEARQQRDKLNTRNSELTAQLKDRDEEIEKLRAMIADPLADKLAGALHDSERELAESEQARQQLYEKVQKAQETILSLQFQLAQATGATALPESHKPLVEASQEQEIVKVAWEFEIGQQVRIIQEETRKGKVCPITKRERPVEGETTNMYWLHPYGWRGADEIEAFHEITPNVATEPPQEVQYAVKKPRPRASKKVGEDGTR